MRSTNLGVPMVLCAVAASGGCSGFGRRPASALIVADPIDHLDTLAREPMVVEHPNGTLFVSGYGASTPTLWKSSDHGVNSMRAHVGNEGDGALGNSDVDPAVASDGTFAVRQHMPGPWLKADLACRLASLLRRGTG